MRWPGIEPDTVTVDNWRSTAPDPAKRVAIIRSYRTLFEHLAGRDDGPWLILQDDIKLTRHPYRDVSAPIHLLGGHLTRHWPMIPPDSPHVHPYAFLATAEAIPGMLDVLGDEHDQLCVTWTRYLAPDTCTWDDPPTATAT